VSDGALSFYQVRFVHTRVSKFTYGSFCNLPFNPTDLDCLKMLQNTFTYYLLKKQLTIRDSA
jgi:hypothetical protein